MNKADCYCYADCRFRLQLYFLKLIYAYHLLRGNSRFHHRCTGVVADSAFRKTYRQGVKRHGGSWFCCVYAATTFGDICCPAASILNLYHHLFYLSIPVILYR